MSRPVFARVRVLAVLVGVMAPTVVLASPRGEAVEDPAVMTDHSRTATAHLRIDVDRSIADAELLPRWIRERHPELAQSLSDEPGREEWLWVKIAGSTYHYRMTVTPMRGDVPVSGASGQQLCECNSEGLLERIDVEVGNAVELLGVHGEEQGGARGGRGDRSLRLGPVGYAGIGLGVLGVASMAAGITVAAREPDDINEEPDGVHIRTARVPGTVIAVAGGAGIAAGVAMVIVSAQRRARTIVVPSVGHQAVGVAVGGRF